MGKRFNWSKLVSNTKKKRTPQYKPSFIGSLMLVWCTVDTITYGRSILIEINAKEKNEVAKLPEINGWHSKVVRKTI